MRIPKSALNLLVTAGLIATAAIPAHAGLRDDVARTLQAILEVTQKHKLELAQPEFVAAINLAADLPGHVEAAISRITVLLPKVQAEATDEAARQKFEREWKTEFEYYGTEQIRGRKQRMAELRSLVQFRVEVQRLVGERAWYEREKNKREGELLAVKNDAKVPGQFRQAADTRIAEMNTAAREYFAALDRLQAYWGRIQFDPQSDSLENGKRLVDDVYAKVKKFRSMLDSTPDFVAQATSAATQQTASANTNRSAANMNGSLMIPIEQIAGLQNGNNTNQQTAAANTNNPSQPANTNSATGPEAQQCFGIQDRIATAVKNYEERHRMSILLEAHWDKLVAEKDLTALPEDPGQGKATHTNYTRSATGITCKVHGSRATPTVASGNTNTPGNANTPGGGRFGGKTYKIQGGDTLGKLATEFAGTLPPPPPPVWGPNGLVTKMHNAIDGKSASPDRIYVNQVIDMEKVRASLKA